MRPDITRRSFLTASLLAGTGVGWTLPQAGHGPSPYTFKLGIITDEVTQDLQQALDFISSYSLGYCELREIWNKNLMNLSTEGLERVRELIQEHHLHVSDIASPVFKYNLPEMPARPAEKRDTFLANFTDQDTEELLHKSCKLARFFGTDKVRIFSYWRVEEPAKAYPYVRRRLAKAAALAARERITLVLENEHECNIGTGKELGWVLRDVNAPSLRGLWDPGNATVLNEVPYPDGYNEVRGLFSHMHIKDSRRDPKTGKVEWAPVGGGSIDFRGQFKALRDDAYAGTMSLETHYRRPDGNSAESTRESLEGLLKVLKSVS
jgi:L-ribulose-5-phosphate 3-epimerase